MTTKKTLLIAIPFLCLAFALSGSCGGDTQSDVATPPEGTSVIILAIDGLRADTLGCYGGPAATPSFDLLASQSVRFDQAWAQSPHMLPSLAAMLTGLYPTSNGFVEPGERLPTEATTLAEAIPEGHARAAFIAGETEGDDHGLSQGFGAYSIVPDPEVKAVEWLAQHQGEEVALLVAGWSTGAIRELAADADPEAIAPAYQQEVERIDSQLGGFITELENNGILDRSIFVVAGTTGMALGEHDDLFEHDLYPSVLRVPLLIRYPQAKHINDVSKIVELVDVMPTLVEATGAPLPDGLQGASLTPIVKDEGNPPYIAFAETDQNGGARASMMGGMQLIVSNDTIWFTDLATDPMALTDVSAEYEDRVKVMQSHLDAWSKMIAAASLDPNRRSDEVDDETLEQLKSLGYVQ